MAIVQISKIQHRRGSSENGPGAVDPNVRLQLASGELGWSIDTRQLYIGNGTYEEGAPTLGNTEILTQYSDVLALSESYTFAGTDAGYSAITGASVGFDVTRSLQSKLDDFVNVRDFGAVGDGVTDDTAAINRALKQIYCRYSEFPAIVKLPESARRVIRFPAGKYKITGDVIKVPSWAVLVGDGSDRTFLIQTDSNQPCVLKTADSLQNVSPNFANQPENIIISGMTIKNTTDNNVVEIVSLDNGRFIDVKFEGTLNPGNTPASPGDFNCCVDISATPALVANNIIFDRCSFTTQIYGLATCRRIRDEGSRVTDVRTINCAFETLNTGVTTELGVSSHFRFLSGKFINIAKSAIATYASTNIISAFNVYDNVGSDLLPTGPRTAPTIDFSTPGSSNCSSIGDQFTRESDSEHPSVKSSDDYPALVLNSSEDIRSGSRRLGIGYTFALVDGTITKTVTPITINTDKPGAVVNYTITRHTGDVRIGKLVIAHTSGRVSYYDDYTETSDVGVELSVSTLGTLATVKYTAAGLTPGFNPVMKYSVDYNAF